MALYSDKVMDHFQNPRNVGKLDDADGIGEVGNAKCGDIMRMYIKVKDGIITDCKFNTFGCGSAIATSSMATELIKGKPIEEALQLSNKAVVEALDGLPAHKIHCSVLAEEAVRAAVKDYYDKNGIAYNPDEFQIHDCEHCHDRIKTSDVVSCSTPHRRFAHRLGRSPCSRKYPLCSCMRGMSHLYASFTSRATSRKACASMGRWKYSNDGAHLRST